MKYVMAAGAETVELIKKSRSLFLLYLLFAFLPVLAARQFTPPIIDLVLMFISLGWFASRFLYIHNLYLHKRLDLSWYRLWEHTLRYALKLLPVVLLLVAAVMLPILLLGVWYGRWFAGSYLNAGLGLTTQEVMQRFIPALFNPLLWKEFFTQNLFMTMVYQSFQLSILVGVLISKLVAILIVIEKFSIWESTVRAFYYLQEHVYLLMSFIVLRVLANILAAIMLAIIGFSLGSFSSFLATITGLVVTTALVFVLDIFIVSFYAKSDKRNFLQRKLMRWWRGSHTK